MPFIDESTLRKEIKSNEPSGVYYLFGQDIYSTEKYVNALIKKAVGKTPSDFNLNKYEGKALILSKLLDDIESLPVFADRKCVAINDLNTDDFNKSDFDALKKQLIDIPDTTVVIIYQTALEIDLKRGKKSSNNIKLINALAKTAANVCELKTKTPQDLAKQIMRSAQKNKCTISFENAKYLAELTLSNQMLLSSEITKLFAYVGEGEITEDIIDMLIAKQIDASSFALANAIVAKNTTKAMETLDDLFYQRIDAIVILSALSMVYIDLYRAKSAAINGIDPAQVVEDYSYYARRFAVTNSFRDTRNMPIEHLRESISILARTDSLLKSSRNDGRTILEKAIVEMLILN